MNYLAHIYLSGDIPEIKIGNFMADSIRGKKYLHYPELFKKGILLHRAIDSYTDAHPIFRQSTKRLHANYSHYSGVIVDIYYDHFLAKNWKLYSDQPLEEYSNEFYDLLGVYYEILPLNIKKMMPYLIADNWLLTYASTEGIGRVLNGMNRRTKNRAQMNLAIHDLLENYEDFEAEFNMFFEEIRKYSSDFLKSL